MFKKRIFCQGACVALNARGLIVFEYQIIIYQLIKRVFQDQYVRDNNVCHYHLSETYSGQKQVLCFENVTSFQMRFAFYFKMFPVFKTFIYDCEMVQAEKIGDNYFLFLQISQKNLQKDV
eukprot:TRINITY_DN9777_c0_g1_i2.p2 TRINITY_DN9777_c0_g1~~TRINITY_DN9777_c0_g1_i2.p2  ORF type:complete len:120 (+),score=1.82 TRINITY_DN9777_c0_g1_i2:130-489(+)